MMLIDFSNVEAALHIWDKFHLVMMYNSFHILLDLIYFVEDFYMFVL